MKIVADQQIPFLQESLHKSGIELELIPGSEISRHHLLDADALLVRTRTQVNRSLLEGTSVRFVGTATIGTDHLNQSDLENMGISWAHAPGCNAPAVEQWVFAALAQMAKSGLLGANKLCLGGLHSLSFGVVGAGNVGSRIVKTAKNLGFKVQVCDPPLHRDFVQREIAAGKEVKAFQDDLVFVDLAQISQCDIVSLHVPLTRQGVDSTLQMLNVNYFESCKSGQVLLNSSRGEVVCGTDLKIALQNGTINCAALDVWENEPNIDQELLKLCSIATPHIAGYSLQGKQRGTAMILEAMQKFFAEDGQNFEICLPWPQSDSHRSTSSLGFEEFLTSYPILKDDIVLRSEPERFEEHRSNYHFRNEMSMCE